MVGYKLDQGTLVRSPYDDLPAVILSSGMWVRSSTFYPGGKAFEVGFSTLSGGTIAVVSQESTQVHALIALKQSAPAALHSGTVPAC